jgi:CRISPR-associated endonuclease Csn1
MVFNVNVLVQLVLLGYEFIKNNGGQIIETGFGGTIKIFDEKSYREFVTEHYAINRTKKRNLLLDEIPDKMIETPDE